MKKRLLAFTILIASQIFAIAPIVRAYDFDKQSGLDATANQTGHQSQKLFSSPDSIDSSINTLIGVVLSFLGVIFLVLMIYGGILWMTARGNEKQVEQAKNIVIDSIIGVAIVSAAYAISYFVLNTFMSQTLNTHQ